MSAGVLTLLDRTPVHRRYIPINGGTPLQLSILRHVGVKDLAKLQERTMLSMGIEPTTLESRGQHHNKLATTTLHVPDATANHRSAQRRTGKPWFCDERTGQWELHIYPITNMIPVVHAARHMAYARSARRYVMCMQSPRCNGNNSRNFPQRATSLFKRSDKLWSGNFTDQTIQLTYRVLSSVRSCRSSICPGRLLTADLPCRIFLSY